VEISDISTTSFLEPIPFPLGAVKLGASNSIERSQQVVIVQVSDRNSTAICCTYKGMPRLTLVIIGGEIELVTAFAPLPGESQFERAKVLRFIQEQHPSTTRDGHLVEVTDFNEVGEVQEILTLLERCPVLMERLETERPPFPVREETTVEVELLEERVPLLQGGLILVLVGVVQIQRLKPIGEWSGGVLPVPLFEGGLIDQLGPIERPEGMGMERPDLLIVHREVLADHLPGGGLREARNQD